LAEGRLRKALEAGEPWAVKYKLDSHGGERGYGRRLEVSGNLGLNPEDAELAKRQALPSDLRRRKIGELLDRLGAE